MEQDGQGITSMHKDFNVESMIAISKHKDYQEENDIFLGSFTQ